MRRIVSKHKEQKRLRKNQFIVGGILIALMLASILGYSFQSFNFGIVDNSSTTDNSVTVDYNGFEFANSNGFWVLNKDGTNYLFRYNPNEVSEISSQIKSLINYFDKPLYVYSENPQAETEIRTSLFSYVEGIEKIESENDIDCEDNSIVIKEDERDIIQDDNCVYITGVGSDLVKNTDEFLFKLLEVRK